MRAKNISIDMEAYKKLKGLKRKDESFSQVIKRIAPVPFDFTAWVKEMESDPFSESFTTAVEEQVAHRNQPRNKRSR